VRELGPPREVDVCGDLVVQHYPSEVNGRGYERSKELAVLDGMKRVSHYLASNPEAVNTAQRVAAENNRREKLSEKHVDVRQTLADAAGATDVSPVHAAEYHTSARTRLLAAWRDPDDQPETWFSSGTSAGSRITPLDCGVFPEVHNAHEDPELLDGQEPEGTGDLREASASALSKFHEYEESITLRPSPLARMWPSTLTVCNSYSRTFASLRRYERVTRSVGSFGSQEGRLDQ